MSSGVRGFGVLDLDVGYRVSGFGIGIWDFGSRVSGAGSQGRGSRV